jgi:hypothetical protein
MDSIELPQILNRRNVKEACSIGNQNWVASKDHKDRLGQRLSPLMSLFDRVKPKSKAVGSIPAKANIVVPYVSDVCTLPIYGQLLLLIVLIQTVQIFFLGKTLMHCGKGEYSRLSGELC